MSEHGIVVKQYGLQRTGTNGLRALLEAHVPGTRVLMHVLGDKHSPPVDLAEVLRAVEHDLHPALAFITLATRLAPAQTTALDSDERQRAYIASIAEEVFAAAHASEIRVLVSVRNPYDWVRGVLLWREELPVQQSCEVDRLVPVVRRMCDRFNTCYAEWFGLADRSPQGAAVVSAEELSCDLGALLDRLVDDLNLRRGAGDASGAGTDAPVGPVLSRTLGATRWDDVPTLFDDESDDRRRSRVAGLDPLPRALAGVVTRRIDWSHLERFGYRPGQALANG